MDVVAIDWSGAASSNRGIWLAHARGGEVLELRPRLSRPAAVEAAIGLAEAAGGSLVLGLDFAFSLPAWFLREKGLGTARALWNLVGEEGEHWLSACEPPFWGRPGRRRPHLEEHLRLTDRRTGVGAIRPKSPFQIGGAGTVGTSSLRGMPFLVRLQEAGFSVWPFDEPRAPLVVEIWPRALTGPVPKRDPARRAAYLRSRTSIAEPLASRASGSEDAFDAAVSALVMSRHAAEFSCLPNVSDPVVKLEGWIWEPRQVQAPGRNGRYTT